ncbi:integumentary mucin C.1-like [Haliotis rubra]|uniref:integumentary mucin C.1-like n=1 Tax=Haliotis rubra TaxID=36100 RepID=UPI001EE61DA1|nr:integumentary mucin C.1-like [Haliotis rubra]
MDASTIFLAALILNVYLSMGQFDGTQDLVLPGSVFQIFRRTTLQQCRRLCLYSSRCLSVNWSSSTRECQLNSKKGNSETLQVSRSNIYLPAAQIAGKGHPCASQPCSTDHMCIPVNTAKDHVCVRVGAFMPTTEAGMTNSATTTATVATTSPQAASATTSTASPTTLEETTTTTTTTVVTTPLPNTNEPELTSPVTTTHISTTTTSLESATSPEPTTSASPAPSTTTTASTTSTPYNGTCVTDIDCAVPPGRTCSGGVCICSIGYDMDETSVTCRKLTDCTSVGSNFTVYTDMAIKGNNARAIYSKTPAECAQVCVDAKDIVCRSFETYFNNCFLQTLTWFDVGDSDRGPLKGADHYQRRCNW